jgi:hypothetical protein
MIGLDEIRVPAQLFEKPCDAGRSLSLSVCGLFGFHIPISEYGLWLEILFMGSLGVVISMKTDVSSS